MNHELLDNPNMPEDHNLEPLFRQEATALPDYVPGPRMPRGWPYPIAQSTDYVPESDPSQPRDARDDEMDIEEDEDADMDIDADEEDEDDEMDVEIDEEAEEEHSAPAYPVVVALPATAPSAEETEPFETDEPLPVPAWADSEVVQTASYISHQHHPLSPWSSSPPQIPFPLSPPSPVLTAPPPSPIRSLGYRAATIRMRAEAAATSHSPPPFILSPTRPDAPPPLPTSAPTSFPPLLLPSDPAERGQTRGINQPPSDEGREIRRDPERYVGYGITDSWDEIVETLQGAPISTDTELGAHMRESESMVMRDTDEIYTRHGHAHTRLLMETEAGMSREAWGRAMDASDLAHGGREMVPLQGLVTTLQGQVTALQGHVMTLQGQVTALQGQQGPAGGPAQPELPEEAGSSS
ncbi:hypothetical protein Tco_0811333 [Tanacetum coccineum]